MKRRRQTAAMLIAVVVGHLALLAWLNLQAPRATDAGEARALAVGLFDLSALLGAAPAAPSTSAAVAATRPPEPEPDLPAEVAVDPLGRLPAVPLEPSPSTPSDVDFTADPIEIGAASQIAAAATGGGRDGDTCGLETKLAAVLQADASVRSAVATIPPEKRSVSNAVMLWNGRWMPLGDGAAPIRAAVSAFVREASADCRAEAVSGPTLLAIAGEPQATILVLGSGLWRWSDLVREPGSGGDGAAMQSPDPDVAVARRN